MVIPSSTEEPRKLFIAQQFSTSQATKTQVPHTPTTTRYQTAMWITEVARRRQRVRTGHRVLLHSRTACAFLMMREESHSRKAEQPTRASTPPPLVTNQNDYLTSGEGTEIGARCLPSARTIRRKKFNDSACLSLITHSPIRSFDVADVAVVRHEERRPLPRRRYMSPAVSIDHASSACSIVSEERRESMLSGDGVVAIRNPGNVDDA